MRSKKVDVHFHTEVENMIQSGDCVSERGVDRCQFCVDRCEAKDHRPKQTGPGLIERNLANDHARFTFEDLIKFFKYMTSDERCKRMFEEYKGEPGILAKLDEVSDLDYEIFSDLRISGEL